MNVESHRTLARLPLEDAHLSAGASLAGIGGWILPITFSSLEMEYQIARENVALLDTSFLTVVAATGKDHLEYMNRRLSQKLIDLPTGQGRRAMLLGGDGKMQADMEVWRLDGDRSLVIAPPDVVGLDGKMNAYVFGEDVRFTDESSSWSAFSLFGAQSEMVLDSLNLPIPETGRIEESSLRNRTIYVIRSEFFPGFITVLLKDRSAIDVYDALLDKVLSLDGTRMGFQTFDLLRIEAACPWFGVDTDENTIPLEASLSSAIHCDKGCYPGQEVLARIMNLGHPSRLLTGIVWDEKEPPEPGSVLESSGEKAGVLTSSAYSPVSRRAIGLAMMKWQFREDGTPVTASDGPSGHVSAIITNWGKE